MDKFKMQTPDLKEKNIDQIASVFPKVIKKQNLVKFFLETVALKMTKTALMSKNAFKRLSPKTIIIVI